MDIAERFAAELLTQLFKESLKGVKVLGDYIADKSSGLDSLGLAAKRYGNQMYERYNVIRIFGMPKLLPLSNIYTKVNVLEKITKSRRMDLETIQQEFDVRQRSFGIPVDTTPGIEAVQQHDKLMVLGKPGSGKTTFLKHIALQNIRVSLTPPRIPIFVVPRLCRF